MVQKTEQSLLQTDLEFTFKVIEDQSIPNKKNTASMLLSPTTWCITFQTWPGHSQRFNGCYSQKDAFEGQQKG